MSTASNVERMMLDLMNDARADVGVKPLKLAVDLNEAAEDHSEWMLKTDTFSHTGKGGSSAGERMEEAGFEFSGSWSWGENIAWQSERGASGIADDVENLFNSLMNSSGHRANILSSSFEYVGIGVERDDFGGWDAVMVTQNFGRTAADVIEDTGGSSPEPDPQPDPQPAPSPSPAPPAPTPPVNTVNSAPIFRADDVTVALVKDNRKRAFVEETLRMRDDDGDTIMFYEVRDREGKQNFRLKGDGKINAEDGYVIAADDLDRLLVIKDKEVGESMLQMRAYDGEDWSKWDKFTLTTVAEDDFFG